MKSLIISLVLSTALSTLAGAEIPSRAKRMKAFEDAGLMAVAAGMDELDQDLLYWRASKSTVEELKRIYPQIEKSRLEALIVVAQ